MLALGTSLFINPSASGATGQGNHTGLFTVGQTALVLGRITVDDSGTDTWEVWVDPDVSGGASGLGPAAASTTADSFTAAGITRLGNVSYHGGSPGVQDGGKVDMIHLSDGPDGFFDVTGFAPTPGTLIYGK